MMSLEQKTDNPRWNRTSFLKLNYDLLDERQVVDALLSRQPEAPFAFVVTPNADHLVRINRSTNDVLHAYLNADLCLNDSRVVGFLAKLSGRSFTTVPGADLVARLFHSAEFDPAWPLLLVGGTEQLFNGLVSKFGLKNARHFDAPMGLLRDKAKLEETVRFAEAQPVRFTFLAVGSPQQELIAHALSKRGKATGIGLCIGAAVEFLVYPERRAPRLMSVIGLEWLFRLIQEPRRLWRRYLLDSPLLLKLVYRDWLDRKGRISE